MQTRLSPKSERAHHPVSYFIVDMPVLFFLSIRTGLTSHGSNIYYEKTGNLGVPNLIICVLLNRVFSAKKGYL